MHDDADNPADAEGLHNSTAASASDNDGAAARAEAAKAAGTRHFRAGAFQRSALAYTLALRLAPRDAVAASNRSAAHARLGCWQRALDDAEAAIKLEPGRAKYWCRKGTALVGLGQAGDGVKAFKRARELEPGYAGAVAGLREAKAAIQAGQRRYEQMWGEGVGVAAGEQG
jgi:tetratricopeptide (TPR) repeat protein